MKLKKQSLKKWKLQISRSKQFRLKIKLRRLLSNLRANVKAFSKTIRKFSTDPEFSDEKELIGRNITSFRRMELAGTSPKAQNSLTNASQKLGIQQKTSLLCAITTIESKFAPINIAPN